MILEIRIVCITCMVSHKSGRRPENCRKLGQRTLVSGILEIPRHQTFASGLLPFYPKLLKANFNQVTRTAHSYNAADSAQAKWGNPLPERIWESGLISVSHLDRPKALNVQPPDQFILRFFLIDSRL